MSAELQWIHPESTVAQAAKLMELFDLGWLPVCREDVRPLGVITDRDIALRVVAQGRAAADTRVAQVMTAPVLSVLAECPAEVACELMSKAGVSRLLVIDEGGHLDGAVSLAGLLAKGVGASALATARRLYRRRSAHPQAGRATATGQASGREESLR